MSSSIRIKPTPSQKAVELSLVHSFEAIKAFIGTPLASCPVALFAAKDSPFLLHESSETGMHTMHGLIKCNLRRMEKKDLATSLNVGIVRGVDPCNSRYPARPSESRVDVLVVQEMYAFGAHVAFRTVVPLRS